MSLKIFGVAKLSDDKLSVEENIKICFFIAEEAIKNRFGIRIGCDVSATLKSRFKNFRGIVPIELTDNPLSSNADFLLAEDNTKNTESLTARMTRIQKFLIELMRLKSLSRIVLDINIMDAGKDSVETVEISVSDFCDKMLTLYQRNNNWTPTVRIIVQ